MPTADPYVRVYVIYKEKQVFKWESTVKRNTLQTVYNESFSYKLTEEMSMAMSDVALSFRVLDYDRFSRHDTMGVVDIGRNASSKLGKKHWTEIMLSPRQRISFWHSIQPAPPAQKHT